MYFLKAEPKNTTKINNFYYAVLQDNIKSSDYGNVKFINEVGLKKFSLGILSNSKWDIMSKVELDLRTFIILKKGMVLTLKNNTQNNKNKIITVIKEDYNINRMEVQFLTENNEKKIFNLKYLMRNYSLKNFQHIKNVYFLNKKTIDNFSKNDPSFHLNNSLEYLYNKAEVFNIKNLKQNDLIIGNLGVKFLNSNSNPDLYLFSVKNIFISNFFKNEFSIDFNRCLNLTKFNYLLKKINRKLNSLKDYPDNVLLIKEIKSLLLNIHFDCCSYIDNLRFNSLYDNFELANQNNDILKETMDIYYETINISKAIAENNLVNQHNVNFSLLEDVFNPFLFKIKK